MSGAKGNERWGGCIGFVTCSALAATSSSNSSASERRNAATHLHAAL